MSYYLGPRVDINGKIRRISIGSGIDESNTYTIYKDGIPVMEATGPRCGWNPFDTAYIFQNHLCIGAGETVYFISIETVVLVSLFGLLKVLLWTALSSMEFRIII